MENASSIFEKCGKAEREAKRKEAATAKEQDNMLKTIGQLMAGNATFCRTAFAHSGSPSRSLIRKNNIELSVRRQCELLGINHFSLYTKPAAPDEEKRLLREALTIGIPCSPRCLTADLDRTHPAYGSPQRLGCDGVRIHSCPPRAAQYNRPATPCQGNLLT